MNHATRGADGLPNNPTKMTAFAFEMEEQRASEGKMKALRADKIRSCRRLTKRLVELSRAPSARPRTAAIYISDVPCGGLVVAL